MAQPSRASMSKMSQPKSASALAASSRAGGGGGGGGGPDQQQPAAETNQFSILPKRPRDQLNWDMIRKNMERRQSPEGEDIRSIKTIIKEIGNNKISVHEFINLIAPYTCDGGAIMREVLTDDVDSFQKLTRKVYETMTQDVSDVLVNEQLHMMGFYQDKRDMYINKMMAAINEIYEMAPEFDFEKYLADKESYLKKIMPLPVIVDKDAEGEAARRRQEAYHRLQWLRGEGERIAEENRRLMQRLEQLREQQRCDQQKAEEAIAKAEAKRQCLLQEEAMKKQQLDELSEAIEKKFVENEAQIKQRHNREGMVPVERDAIVSKKKKKKGKRADWVVELAQDIEEVGIKSAVATARETLPISPMPPSPPPPCKCPTEQGGRGVPFQQPQQQYQQQQQQQPVCPAFQPAVCPMVAQMQRQQQMQQQQQQAARSAPKRQQTNIETATAVRHLSRLPPEKGKKN